MDIPIESWKNISTTHLQNINEDLDMAFWREMEEIAVQMGMRYYEDMTDEELEEISKKYGHKFA